MARRTKRDVITSDASLEQARRTSPVLKRLLRAQHNGHHSNGSVREAHYKGHHIVIKTTYDVKVDGKPFNAPLNVSNTGNVEYHGMPNVGFASAIDLMRSVIDLFPGEFAKKGRRPPAGHHHAARHAQTGDQSGGRTTSRTAKNARSNTARRK